jgi:truncated hemoglobin YjbI/ferredoxin
MAKITYQGGTYDCREGESLLDAFLRQGVELPFSCRAGICHVCKQQAVRGPVPEAAQKGLNPREREQGYFRPCRCEPIGDMEIAGPGGAQEAASAAGSAAPGIAPVLPDGELWEALGEGTLLREILERFYDIVYKDERLSPFFTDVTKARAVEKQYLYLRQLFSGEKVYFGDRPRNAHHWMVISDELFDYREALMASCLREAGLPEHLVTRWLAVEESFRSDIVKDQPVSRVMNGVEMPLDGFGEEVLDVGSICDGCESEIEPGTRVRYHLRLGKLYCPQCSD